VNEYLSTRSHIPFLISLQEARSLANAYAQCCFDLDAALVARHPDLNQGGDTSGSTLVSVMLTPTHVVFGNTGDSRAFLVRDGKVHFATQDHKPSDPEESKRIIVRARAFSKLANLWG